MIFDNCSAFKFSLSLISLNFTALWNWLFCESVIKLTLSWQVGSQIMGKVISWSFQGFKVFRYFHLVVYTYTSPGSPFQSTPAPSPPQEGREQGCSEKVAWGCIRIYYLRDALKKCNIYYIASDPHPPRWEIFHTNFVPQNDSEWLEMDFKHNFRPCNILTCKIPM